MARGDRVPTGHSAALSEVEPVHAFLPFALTHPLLPAAGDVRTPGRVSGRAGSC